VWVDPRRRQIRVTVAVGVSGDGNSGSLTATVKRRRVAVAAQTAGGTLDQREFDICKRTVARMSEVLKGNPAAGPGATMRAIRDSFDEDVIAQHIENHHDLQMSITTLLADLHSLSEQTYENRALSFGCIIDSKRRGSPTAALFPRKFLIAKKYKAPSDGFRTAYYISTNGRLLNFVDLETFESRRTSGHSYFPEWAEPLARNSREGRYGIALSRQGDILVFDGCTIRFSHRNGRWQYWNHNHIVNLLRDRAKAQRVLPRIVSNVVVAIYLGALDVSFRRSGGLFVILHNRRKLREIVRSGDAIGDGNRTLSDRNFDAVLLGRKIQGLPSAMAVELAALDGAIVLSNDGEILAYGAILSPKKAGRLQGTEGSRTKAAIGASNYGLAVKISSDGDIDVYHKGKSFMRVSQSG
jgi:hypothetical protein